MTSLVITSLLAVACAHKAPAPVDNTPVSGPMQKADKTFLSADPDSSRSCQADADCPVGDFCHPDQRRCFQPYPNPRMLDLSYLPEKECPVVNVYFPFDSVELVPEAQRWLEYDIRCLKSRNAQRLILEAFCDARGTQGYNLKLSERRGEYVKNLLEQKGLTIPIEVLGEGKRHPIRTGTTEKDYAFNRRVEFKVE
jgi:outer membrane protein OmpA-like peptidoglycan-associated protein